MRYEEEVGGWWRRRKMEVSGMEGVGREGVGSHHRGKEMVGRTGWGRRREIETIDRTHCGHIHLTWATIIFKKFILLIFIVLCTSKFANTHICEQGI